MKYFTTSSRKAQVRINLSEIATADMHLLCNIFFINSAIATNERIGLGASQCILNGINLKIPHNYVQNSP